MSFDRVRPSKMKTDGEKGLLFPDDATRWEALVARDPRADGAFFYGVTTTGVYCRPTCSSRVPNWKNVVFFENALEAERAGLRPCKRCEPDKDQVQQLHTMAVVRACRLIEETKEPLSLRELAASVGISPYHFHRIFKKIVGITPKEYVTAKRTQRIIKKLSEGRSVTHAIYDAGFGASSRFYEGSARALGMAPAQYKAGAAGLEIRYAVRRTFLGLLLVGATERGVCAMEFGETPELLIEQLRKRFPKARLIEGGTVLADWVSLAMAFLETPRGSFGLPLDIQGTAFQQRVWKALQAIPAGATVSYREVAEYIGAPRAARAVARACASNPVAVAIPCHRVLRSDGGLGGYHWGVQRKRALLDRETAARKPAETESKKMDKEH